LQKIGLPEYKESFFKNDIDSEEVLRSLTERDLEKVGVNSLGHRKRILESILSDSMKSNSKTPWLPGQQIPDHKIEVKTSSGSGVWKAVGWLLAIVLILVIIAMVGI